MAGGGDIAVVGTGIVGLAVAAALLKHGFAVSVIGPRSGDHDGQATRAAGAMLSTFSEVEPHHEPERVRVETAERVAATELYPAWLAEINAAGGTEVRAIPGTWVLAAPGQVGHLEVIAATARASGFVAEDHPPSEIGWFRPPTSCPAALWLPAEARVDSASLMTALTRAVVDHPRCRWRDTTALRVTGNHVVCRDGSRIRAEEVVLAAGTGIPALLPDGGADLGVPPILAGRGASALLRAPGLTPPHVIRTPNAAFACGVHLVPRDDGTVYLGGTNRLSTSPDPHRRATLDELTLLGVDAAAVLVPALRAAQMLAARVGLRPYTVDHLPLLGRTRDPSLLLATATYRCGIMLAPRIGELIAEEITRPGALAEHPYRVRRPMPAPDIESVLGHGAAALLEHLLQGGGHLPAAAAAEFTAFTALALRGLIDQQTIPEGEPLRRLWAAAPVPEALPSLFALAHRLGDTRP